jgi:hypothetical protein
LDHRPFVAEAVAPLAAGRIYAHGSASAHRGVDDSAAAGAFFDPALKTLHAPELLCDASKAAALIAAKVR